MDRRDELLRLIKDGEAERAKVGQLIDEIVFVEKQLQELKNIIVLQKHSILVQQLNHLLLIE